jgi:hypothetical protein
MGLDLIPAFKIQRILLGKWPWLKKVIHNLTIDSFHDRRSDESWLGLASRLLLETYTVERQPVGAQVVER